MLPKDLPNWKTVNDYITKWRKDGTWQRLNDALREQARVAAGRDKTPSAGSLDSQSVKTTQKGSSRLGWGKHLKGRKRHLVVDTMGFVLKAFGTEADYHDRSVGSWRVPLLPDKIPRLRKLWADGGYTGEWLTHLPDDCPIAIEIVQPPAGQRGFTVIPWRWVV